MEARVPGDGEKKWRRLSSQTMQMPVAVVSIVLEKIQLSDVWLFDSSFSLLVNWGR